ncbi:sulfatase [Marinilongibacter aquaticus]|uniref:sulfatase family protein n=1 Tax=Marinilongibacter aquaticus TaxID=2975157 RepID=UPI0021BD04B4|nr:sulfatase [Marinilongibacter aquaticus]UBM59919.1 sulfatase [Marinilongibacter aquaticus]
MKNLKWILLAFIGLNVGNTYAQKQQKPNFIVIFTDDQGYGDLSCFGHPTIKTPNIDRMAFEGQKWTNFYVASNVCTPSRFGLMTGRLPVRGGMEHERRRVLFPDSKGGIQPKELTIAEMLKTENYSTACVGKWHLGHLPQFLPTSNGFDYYFGIPYSNDMDRNPEYAYQRFQKTNPDYHGFNVPILRNETEIERPANQNTLTQRYTEESVKFIKEHKDKPFFLYMAHNMPHIPLFNNKKFAGTSDRGLYGDVVEEIDWSVGQIFETLRAEGLEDNTYVIFTTDNGPWLVFGENGGSAGLLYGGKGTSYEGGQRVPCVIWGKDVKPGIVSKMGSTLDILPTICSLAGIDAPKDRVLDGFDISPVMRGEDKTPRDVMFYYHATKLFAVRKGAYKLYFLSNNPLGYPAKIEVLEKPTLFNVMTDPSEKYNVADDYPEIVSQLKKLAEEHLATVEEVPNQLVLVEGK